MRTLLKPGGGVEAEIAAWIGAFSYPAVFFLLVLCGMGAPLSEDLIIVTGGLVAAQSGASLPGMMLVGFLGILMGDSLLYRLGRALGPRAFSHPKLQRVLTPPRVAFLQTQFSRRGVFAMFLVRFMPGFRAPSYLLAGASGFSYRRFVAADAVGALLFAPAVTWLGFRFGSSVLTQLRGGLRWVVLGVVAAGLCALVVKRLRRRSTALPPAPVIERETVQP
jgi:membrane protein DedA with SNARE-associated domain